MTVPATTFTRSWWSMALWGLALVLLSGAGFVAWCIYVGVSTSLQAEVTLHAMNEACELVTEYARQLHGAWPRSWQDLERLPVPADRFKAYSWPEDSQRLQQHVTIDFTADPERLAKESVDEFDAIKPIGPCYPYKQYEYVPDLLSALRKHRHTKQLP